MTDSVRNALATLARRLHLPVRAVVAVIASASAFVVAVAGFGGLTEDVAAHNGQQRYDLGRLDWFVHHRTSLEVHAADVLAHAGAVAAMAVLALLATALLWRRRESIAVAGAPVTAFALAAAGTTVAKSLVGRARPPVPLRLVADTEPSFPSGHTTATTAVILTIVVIVAVVVLRRTVPRVLVLTSGAAFAVAVGISRIVLGAHWPTDVVAGWLLGAAVASIVLAAASVLAPHLPSGPEAYGRTMARWRARRGDDAGACNPSLRACAETA